MIESHLQRNVRLAAHTSLRVGGPADWFLLATSADMMANGLAWARQRQMPVRVMGGGSNLLVSDAGVEGLVIKAANAAFEVVDRGGEPVLLADAGLSFANVARKLAKQGLGGIEWASNVPGTVGGAVVNNAGAFGGDTASCLLAATVVDDAGVTRRIAAADMAYAYRTSALKRRELGGVAVTRVELRLVNSTPEQADGLVKAFQAQRTRSQPRTLSAGSVFANPAGDFAGRLIEASGLKGERVGAAEISTQHANFIVNAGGARAADVYALVRRAQAGVFDQFGVWLRPEIELLGRWTSGERLALASEVVANLG